MESGDRCAMPRIEDTHGTGYNASASENQDFSLAGGGDTDGFQANSLIIGKWLQLTKALGTK